MISRGIDRWANLVRRQLRRRFLRTLPLLIGWRPLPMGSVSPTTRPSLPDVWSTHVKDEMPRRDRYDEDDDFDDRPRRSRRGEPRRRSRYDERFSGKPGLATTAAVFWLIWAGFLFLAFIVRAALL